MTNITTQDMVRSSSSALLVKLIEYRDCADVYRPRSDCIPYLLVCYTEGKYGS